MIHDENKKNVKIEEFLFVVKFLSLLSSVIAYFQYFYRASDLETTSYFYISTIIVVVFGLVISFYLLWMYYYQKKRVGNSKLFKWIECGLLFGVFFMAVMLTGAYESKYKILFLYLIVCYTLDCGMKTGLFLSFISSAVIFVTDILKTPKAQLNDVFEADILIAGIFVITAWAVGFYFKTESEFITKLKKLINIDGLTSLYNHRYFHETLQKITTESRERGESVALIFLDIDYFKMYNDFHGHQQGDKVLRQMADVIKGQVRPQDILSRYGGEEFSIILPNTTKDEAYQVAQKIRQAVEEYNFPGQDLLPNHNLTVSLGVSVLNDRHVHYLELIKDADDALYRAKFLRKNCVECYYSVFDELQTEQDDVEGFRDTITTAKTLIAVINSRDKYTFGHVERVVTYVQLISDRLQLNPAQKRTLIFGAYMHDIGKINISKELLIKPTPLEEDEWNELKQHPINGVEITKNIKYLNDVTPLILQHHERYDGTGYPYGLKGQEINYLARILTIADSFDAMTSYRTYKKRKSLSEGCEELIKCSGTQFDPELVEVFVNAIKENLHG